MRRRAGIVGIVLAAAVAAAPPALAREGHPDGHGPPAHTVEATTTSPGKGKPKEKEKGSAASRRQVARGVVQSITIRAVVLTQLDGSTVTVPINRRTRIFINRKRARRADVKPGFVLTVAWKTGKPAKVLRFVRPA